MINLESLTEQSRLQDVHFLQEKLYEYQKNVRSLTNIYIFLHYGLWNYDFSLYCLDPKLAITKVKNFRKLFFKVIFRLFSLKLMRVKKAFIERTKEINQNRLFLITKE